MKKKLYEITEIPPGIINGYNMEIYSGKEIVINGSTEIEELSETVLKIKINEHRISLYGNNIYISCYTGDAIKINGRFEQIILDEGEVN